MLFKNFNELKELENSFLDVLDFYPEIEPNVRNNIIMQMKASFRKSLLLLFIKNGERR